MDDSTARAKLVEMVVTRAKERAAFFTAILPLPTDPPETNAKKQEFLLNRLREWAADPVLFIKENAWVPDPRNLFGSDAMPEGISPKGMVPLLPVPKLMEVTREIDRLFESGEEWDFIADKPRQFALTTDICWWLLHKFLFRKGFTAVLGSGKGPEEIDAGGKGKRDATSLFGRLRLFLDAFMWNLSVPEPDGTRTSLLKFNQHIAPLGGRYPAQRKALVEWRRNLTGMGDSDDTSNRLSRPKWIVHGIEMFSAAEGNWILGNVPGDGFARSQTCSCAFIDEFPHCNSQLGADTDRLSWAACAVNTRFRIAVGTWPRGGSGGTEMYRIVRSKPPTARIMHIHWTDLPVYLFGAHWTCPCGHANDWSARDTTGHEGVVRKCSGCLKETRVTRFMVSSPWLRKACAKLSHDRVSIASEIMNDPEGTVEDRLFNPWRSETGVRHLELPPRDRLAMLDGFDPGTSALDPACWMLAALDVKTMRLQIVGYWMAAETFAEWWVPFIKRSAPDWLDRNRPQYGFKSDNRTFREAFDYPPLAIEMMRRVSSRAPADYGGGLRFPHGMIGGDKFGSHRSMGESPYDRIRPYGIEVHCPYTEDREALMRKAVEWSSRVTLWDEIADIEPPGPLGPWPSLRQVFEGARSKPQTGHGAYRFDVDHKEPPHVAHAVDTFAYLVRCIEDRVRAVVTADGTWEQESGGGKEPWSYAGGAGEMG